MLGLQPVLLLFFFALSSHVCPQHLNLRSRHFSPPASGNCRPTGNAASAFLTYFPSEKYVPPRVNPLHLNQVGWLCFANLQLLIEPERVLTCLLQSTFKYEPPTNQPSLIGEPRSCTMRGFDCALSTLSVAASELRIAPITNAKIPIPRGLVQSSAG